MKKKLLALLLFAGLFSFTSCEVDEIDMHTDYFDVGARSWEWNDIYRRYEFIFDYWEIDPYMYTNGTITAGVYITEVNGRGERYEVLRMLPYTYTLMGSEKPFSETIGFDISPGGNGYPGQITFYIQASDLVQSRATLKDYQFKVTSLRQN